MRSERLGHVPHDLRWRVGWWVFVVLVVVGGACAGWALQQLRSTGARVASQDAQAMAQSVAQGLAQQLGRAVRLGIPLPELPGVAPYLQAALARQPGLTHIAIELPGGQVLHSAGRDAGARSGARQVRVPLAAGSGEAGAVLVQANASASMQRSLQRAAWLSAAAVLALAMVGALAAALGPAAQMQAQRRQVLARLAGTAPAGGAAPGQPDDSAHTAGAHGLPALAQALARGDAQLQAARRSVQSYGQELLAMDFDGHMRAEVERIVQASGAGQAGQATHALQAAAPAREA